MPPKFRLYRGRMARACLARLYTLSDAKRIPGPIVYALLDEGSIFYVGKTTYPRERFAHHKYIEGVHPNLRPWLRKAGDRVRVQILEHNPEDLSAAEAAWIRKLGANLINILWNSPSSSPRIQEQRDREYCELVLNPFKDYRPRDESKIERDRATASAWMATNRVTKLPGGPKPKH